MVKLSRRALLWLCAESTYLSETGMNIYQRGLYLGAKQPKLEVQCITKSAFSTDRAQKADATPYAALPPLPPMALAVPPRSPGISWYYY